MQLLKRNLHALSYADATAYMIAAIVSRFSQFYTCTWARQKDNLLQAQNE